MSVHFILFLPFCFILFLLTLCLYSFAPFSQQSSRCGSLARLTSLSLFFLSLIRKDNIRTPFFRKIILLNYPVVVSNAVACGAIPALFGSHNCREQALRGKHPYADYAGSRHHPQVPLWQDWATQVYVQATTSRYIFYHSLPPKLNVKSKQRYDASFGRCINGFCSLKHLSFNFIDSYERLQNYQFPSITAWDESMASVRPLPL